MAVVKIGRAKFSASLLVAKRMRDEGLGPLRRSFQASRDRFRLPNFQPHRGLTTEDRDHDADLALLGVDLGDHAFHASEGALFDFDTIYHLASIVGPVAVLQKSGYIAESIIRDSYLAIRLAQRLSLDAWAAHSAGLFEECGKAVLFRHAPDHYRAMLRAAPGDVELVVLEHAGFGVSHDKLGAALCESWGLGAAAVASVRQHVEAQASHVLSDLPAKRPVLALSVMAHALETEPETLDDVARVIAPQADLDPTLVLRALRQVQNQREEAAAHDRD